MMMVSQSLNNPLRRDDFGANWVDANVSHSGLCNCIYESKAFVEMDFEK